jgi:hypothetical protein
MPTLISVCPSLKEVWGEAKATPDTEAATARASKIFFISFTSRKQRDLHSLIEIL